MAERPGIKNIPYKIRSALKARGVNVDDAKVRRAVLATLQVDRGPSFRAALRAYRRGFLRGLSKELEKAAEKSSRMAARMGSMMILLGFVAIVANLVSGFESFRESISKLLLSMMAFLKTSGVIATAAYAQTGTPVPIPPPSQLIGPVFVYLVYVLFSIGYVVSLYGMLFGKQPKDKANAMELLRNLTAFFIGAISGKFV